MEEEGNASCAGAGVEDAEGCSFCFGDGWGVGEDAVCEMGGPCFCFRPRDQDTRFTEDLQISKRLVTDDILQGLPS